MSNPIVADIVAGIANEPSAAVVDEKGGQEQDLFSPKFAALSRKEKELRDKERQFEEQRRSLESERSKYESMSKLKESDPLKWLEEQGLNFESVAERYLNNGNPTAEHKEKQLIDKIAELEERLESRFSEADKKREEEAKANEERAVANFKEELAQFVDQNASDYELIKSFNANDLIYEVIEATYGKTQKVMSYKEASDIVESHLEGKAKELLKINKLRGGEPTKPSEEVHLKREPSSFSATLSNRHSSEVPSQSLDNSEEARRARALAILNRS